MLEGLLPETDSSSAVLCVDYFHYNDGDANDCVNEHENENENENENDDGIAAKLPVNSPEKSEFRRTLMSEKKKRNYFKAKLKKYLVLKTDVKEN